MKPIDVCKGCGARRLVNHLKLCKRCNKDASSFLSKSDIAKAAQEREALFAAKAKMKEVAEMEKAEADAKKEVAEGEKAKVSEEAQKDEKEGKKSSDAKKEKK